ncbi:nicotinate-nucleotide adenylyltransferase [Treponema bryantii]|uniref:Probable nicotinate-nucleotide adenylyltransferase n=1 Tax=Treponema bryantii TaxID=163 RepID=A0A1I3JMH8_9SPIR|nr:nicotinate (nicotinamide) nucleotide adenylyltransferase [Treponema bryantii]SFI61366.1 nicotinate-nucleotide adenylyltransferase [Treponema bryantii]
MKVAVFGGTFNPLHVGHAMLADTIVKELGYDKVLFVPTYQPPHKDFAKIVSAEHRMAMISHFCKMEGSGHFELETCEIDRGGISYTSDTLEFLTKKYEGKLSKKLAFVMGDEVAAEFHKWRNPQRISELADLLIVHRYPDVKALETSLYDNKPTGDYKGDFSVKFDLKNFAYPCIYIENPMLPVSSTDIRRRISEDKSFRYLVPPAVFDYIIENGLYVG